MKQLQNLINEVIEAKINDGSLQKIVDETIEKMIKDILTDSLRWSSPAYKYAKDKLDAVMDNAIRQSNFDAYVDAFKITLDSVMSESCLNEYKEECNKLQFLLGEHTVAPKEVKLTEMFDKFKDCVEQMTVSESDEFSYKDDGQARVVCKLEVEYESYSESAKTITFYVDKDHSNDESDIFNEKYEFKSFEYNGYGYIKFDASHILELKHADEFTIYLMKLAASYTHVIFDTEYDEENAYVNISY